MTRHSLSPIVVLLCAVSFVASCGASNDLSATPTFIPQSSTGPERGPRIREFAQVVSRDAILPIYNPQFVNAADSGYQDDELVMGVEIEGQSKAYPVTLLTFREMVNDELAGVPILVTWCPLCYTGLVHDRRINGKAVVFGNQGALYLNGMTWCDHETESLWSQPLGEAIGGPLMGAQLPLLPSSTAPWATWRREHPQTLALHDENYALFNSSSRKTTQNNYWIGVVLGAQSHAYPYGIASAERLIQEQIGDVPLLVLVNPLEQNVHIFVRATDRQILDFELRGDILRDRQSKSQWDRAHGIATAGSLKGIALRPFPYIPAYARAWRAFHPESWIYQGQGKFLKP